MNLQLIKKELRENVVPAGFGLFLFSLTVYWGTWDGHWVVPRSGTTLRVLFASVVFGTCFGFDQIRRERTRKTWSYVTHRGASVAELLRAKRVAAAGIWFVVLLLPAIVEHALQREGLPPILEKHAVDRLIEVVLLHAWFFPAYAVAQWQALSAQDGGEEYFRRAFLALTISVAPLVLLTKLDPHLPASRGFMLLGATTLCLTLAASWLANRRAERLHSISCALPRFERLVSVSVACVATLVCVSASVGQSRNYSADSVIRSLGVLAANETGEIALEEFSDGGDSSVVTLEGELLPWNEPIHQPAFQGQPRDEWKSVYGDWYCVIREGAAEENFGLRFERSPPFTLTRWRLIPDSHGRWAVVEPSMRCILDSIPNQPSNEVTWPADAAPIAPGNFMLGFLTSPYEGSSTHGNGYGEQWTWRGQRGAVLSAPGARTLTVVGAGEDFSSFPVPKGDRALAWRIEQRESLRLGVQLGEYVLVGEKGEYVYDVENRSFVAWVDDTPEVLTLRYKDPMRGDTVLSDGREVVRNFDEANLGTQRRIARVLVAGSTLLGTPVSTVASTLLEAPWFPERTFTWTFLLDWGVAGGRRLWLTGLHLLLAAFLSWRVSRRLTGRRDRRAWVAVTLALGCVGYLLARLEAYNRKEIGA